MPVQVQRPRSAMMAFKRNSLKSVETAISKDVSNENP